MPFKQTYSFANRQGTALSLKHIFKQPLTGPQHYLVLYSAATVLGISWTSSPKPCLAIPQWQGPLQRCNCVDSRQDTRQCLHCGSQLGATAGFLGASLGASAVAVCWGRSPA